MTQVGELVAVISALGALLSSCAALIVAFRNSTKIHEIHVSLNGRLDELLKVTASAAHAEGQQAERDRALIG